MHGRAATRRGPSDRALDRLAGYFAIALRLGSAAMCAIAGPLAGAGGVSGPWLAAVIGTLCAWSLLFARAVWRRGPARTLVLADAAVVIALVTTQQHVVPMTLIADGTTWMLPVASTAVFIPQLTLPPVLSLPVAGLVTAAYATTVPHPTGASFLVVQTVVTAALIALVRRGGRSADAVIAADLRAEQEIRAEAARRADEREQYRRVHDTILSTLTMVAAGAFDAGSPTLSAQAARDRHVLRELPAMPAADPESAALLADRLARCAASAAPLRVSLSITPETPETTDPQTPDPQTPDPPPAVAEQIAACVAEALRNIARHARVDRAEVTLTRDNRKLTVEITDQGEGFDPATVPRSRRGLTQSIDARMAEIGGTATLTSTPGHGTKVILRWPR